MRSQQQQQLQGAGSASSRTSISPRGLAAVLHHQQHQQQQPFSLAANTREAYRDLLIFEERLKQNSQRLATQRRKYEAFLISLIFSIVFLAYKVFLTPSPYTFIQFLNSGLLLIGIVTLVLFFATGVYSEKIAYAYKFVPQANRALRYFNIYLNTKQPPRSWSFNPLRFFRASSSSSSITSGGGGGGTPALSRTLSSSGSARSSPTSRNSTNNSTSPSPRSRTPYGASSSRASAIPLAPLPPASNPRGELVFSSKVNPTYREGYEKYRSDWEKRRKPSRHELSWSARIVSSVLRRSRSPSSSSRASTGTNKTATSSSSTATQENPKFRSSRSSPRKAAAAAASSSSSALVSPSDDQQSDSSVNVDVKAPPSPVARGRDSRARPLIARSGSTSSVSSIASATFSSSPPISRRTSPLRHSQSQYAFPSSSSSRSALVLDDGTQPSGTNEKTGKTPLSSPSPSSRASTPDLIREDDEYLSYYPHNGQLPLSASTQSLLLARRRQNLTSTSESSLASGSGSVGAANPDYYRRHRIGDGLLGSERDADEDDSVLESPPDMSPHGKVTALPRTGGPGAKAGRDAALVHGHRPRASSFNEFLEELREEEMEGRS